MRIPSGEGGLVAGSSLPSPTPGGYELKPRSDERTILPKPVAALLNDPRLNSTDVKG